MCISPWLPPEEQLSLYILFGFVVLLSSHNMHLLFVDKGHIRSLQWLRVWFISGKVSLKQF
jgi:hypothetical protein